MATVIIVMTDDDTGTVDVEMKFYPPVTKDVPETPAQRTAATVLDALMPDAVEEPRYS